MAADNEFVDAIFIDYGRDDAMGDAFAAGDDTDGAADQGFGHVVANRFKLAVAGGCF